MANAYLVGIHRELTPVELSILEDANVQSAENLRVLAATFRTSLQARGVNLTKLSALSSQGSNAKFQRNPSVGAQAKGYTHGALQPAGVLSGIGYRKQSSGARPAVMSQGLRTAIGAASGVFPPLSLRTSRVRDQGERGTCVAHALAAVREFSCGDPAAVELSPQFLFWAAKVRGGDPEPGDDGTRLEFARAALSHVGVCEERRWAYVDSHRHTVHQGPPPVDAEHDAKGYAHQTHYENSTALSGNAAKVLSALQHAQAPVAVSLAVFADSPDAPINNWTQQLAERYGCVIDPPAGAVVVAGHAVCITAFVPDPSENSGGYFTFLNSWGPGWGNLAGHAPAPHHHSPARGHGYISATYVDQFLWELCRLELPASKATAPAAP